MRLPRQRIALPFIFFPSFSPRARGGRIIAEFSQLEIESVEVIEPSIARYSNRISEQFSEDSSVNKHKLDLSRDTPYDGW